MPHNKGARACAGVPPVQVWHVRSEMKALASVRGRERGKARRLDTLWELEKMPKNNRFRFHFALHRFPHPALSQSSRSQLVVERRSRFVAVLCSSVFHKNIILTILYQYNDIVLLTVHQYNVPVAPASLSPHHHHTVVVVVRHGEPAVIQRHHAAREIELPIIR